MTGRSAVPLRGESRGEISNAYPYRRTPLACIPCRKRKSKCSGKYPTCRNCERFGKTCQWPDIDSTSAAIREAGDGPSPLSSTGDAIDLPEAEARFLITSFFATQSLGLVAYSLHRPSLETTPIGEIPRFLLYSLCSLAAISIPQDQFSQVFKHDNPSKFSSRLAATAQQLSRETSDSPSVSAAQGNLLIAYRELLCSRGMKAWMYTGLAIRMAQALRLGKEYHSRHSPLEREIRRRVMWTCFTFDRLLSLISSRPQTIKQGNLFIQLPCPDNAFLFGEIYTGPYLHNYQGIGGSDSLLPFIIKAIDLWGDMVEYFVTGYRFRSPNPPLHPESRFFKSEKALTDWRSRLPARLTWSSQNYATHRMVGHGCLYTTHLLILNQASCVVHQEYLPQRELQSHQLNPLQNGNGSEDLDLNDHMISSCLHRADEITAIALHLSNGDAIDQENLNTPFCGLALVNAATIYLWHIYVGTTMPVQHSSLEEVVDMPAEEKLVNIFQILHSWTGNWKIAHSWCETIELLTEIYAAAYGKPRVEYYYNGIGLTNGEVEPDQEEHLAMGSGVPDPDSGYQPLFQKIRNTLVSTSESSDLRKEQTERYIQALWREMYCGGLSNVLDIGITATESMSNSAEGSHLDDYSMLLSGDFDTSLLATD